jgi:hypothetical protein
MRRVIDLIVVLFAVPFAVVAAVGFAVMVIAGLILNVFATASNRAQGGNR